MDSGSLWTLPTPRAVEFWCFLRVSQFFSPRPIDPVPEAALTLSPCIFNSLPSTLS